MEFTNKAQNGFDIVLASVTDQSQAWKSLIRYGIFTRNNVCLPEGSGSYVTQIETCCLWFLKNTQANAHAVSLMTESSPKLFEIIKA